MVCALVIYTTSYIKYKYTDTYRHIYWISSTISITSFFLNETWFMFTMLFIEDQIKKIWKLDEKNKWKLNEIEMKMIDEIEMKTILVWRERAQKMSVYFHMFFLHVLPNVTCIYCIINSSTP